MNNKKLALKKLLVVVLAAILFAVCITSSTFSWFTTSTSSNTRPSSSTGGKMTLTLPAQEGGSASPLKAYDGSRVTMSTEVSNDDGIHFYSLSNLPSGMPATSVLPYTTYDLGTTSPSNRIYYRTTIVNGSTTPQNVSLYIKNFAPNGASPSGSNISVGVNEPIKAFKNYSMTGVTIPAPTKTTKKAATKRIYFKPVSEIPSGNRYDGTRSNWAPPSGTSTTTPYYYVKSGIDGAYNNSNRFYRCTASATSVWYADIPWGDNQLYISYVDNPGNDGFKRTQDFTDLYGDGLTTLQSLCFFINGSYNDYNNALAGKYTCTGANIATYYDNITVSNVTGQTIDASLASGDYSSNNGISYGSYRKSGNTYYEDSSKFTVNSSGVITPVAAGTGYLRYRTRSEYGEYFDQYVKVNVNDVPTNTNTIPNAPIVTNLLIPAATTQGQTNADSSNVQVVYWFIQNGDPMYGTASAAGSYTLESIYLGL